MFQRLLCLGLLIMAMPLAVGAAPASVRQDLKRLNLTEAQVTQVLEIWKATELDLDRARAEAKVAQAEVAKLLLEASPDRAALEKQVRRGAEAEVQAKMVRIDRSLRLRALLGNEAWAVLSKAALGALEDRKAGRGSPRPQADDKPAFRELLQRLGDLN